MMQPYSPRPIRFWGTRRAGGWTLKLYSVAYEAGRPIDWEGFEPALRLAEAALPPPDVSRGRPGLGFLIAHQGATGDYTVLAWWDNENELPLRVWVRRDREDPWRPAQDGESICVWDLEIIWAERQAWIECLLSGDVPDRDEYLARAADGQRTGGATEPAL
jgi:hypothetical protein